MSSFNFIVRINSNSCSWAVRCAQEKFRQHLAPVEIRYGKRYGQRGLITLSGHGQVIQWITRNWVNAPR